MWPNRTARRRPPVPAVVAALAAVLTLGGLTQARTLELWNLNVSAASQAWYLNEFKPAFEARHPGVTVNISFPPQAEFYDRMVVQTAAGNPPDVFSSNNALFYVEGFSENLGPYLERWDRRHDLLDIAATMISYKGVVYGIPLGLAPRTLVVNTRILAESGYDAANPPTEWDEIQTAARRLTQWSPDRSQILQAGVARNTEVWTYQGLTEAYGGRTFDDDGFATFNRPEGVHALESWGNLLRDVAPPGVPMPGNAEGKTAFFLYTNQALFVTAANAGPDIVAQLAVAPRPVTVQTASVPLAGAPLGISAYAQDKQLAWELLAFHFEPEMTWGYNRAQGFLPPLKSALTPDVLEEFPWFALFVEHMAAYGSPLWSITHPQFGIVRPFLQSAIDAYVRGEGAAQALLDEAARQWDAVVRERSF